MGRHFTFMGNIFLLNDIKEKLREFVVSAIFTISMLLFVVTMISIIESQLYIALLSSILYLIFVGLYYYFEWLFKN